MVHMDLALEEGGESQGQGHHSTEAEERIREVVGGKKMHININLSNQVWAHNLEDEFKEICRIVADFNYVAMDTEFPGVVARPIGEFKSTSDYQYQVGYRQTHPNRVLLGGSCQSLQLLRCNVDLLKIIQLGLTFFNKEGGTPEGVCTWQVTACQATGLLADCSLFSVQLQVQPVRGHVCRG